MKKRLLFLSIILLMTLAGFSQDTSKLANSKFLKESLDTSNTIARPAGAANLNNNPAPPNTTVNPNTGTAIPNTTSGTLGSSVNPNTQVIIPIKGKRKAKVHVTPDSDTNAPK